MVKKNIQTEVIIYNDTVEICRKRRGVWQSESRKYTPKPASFRRLSKTISAWAKKDQAEINLEYYPSIFVELI